MSVPAAATRPLIPIKGLRPKRSVSQPLGRASSKIKIPTNIRSWLAGPAACSFSNPRRPCKKKTAKLARLVEPTRNARRFTTHQVNAGFLWASSPMLNRILPQTPRAIVKAIATSPASPIKINIFVVDKKSPNRRPNRLIAAPIPRIITVNKAVINPRRPKGFQSKGGGCVPSGFSGANMVINIAKVKTLMATNNPAHIFPAAINLPTLKETRITGIGTSRMALTPE